MSQTYTKLLYHIVFSTKNRMPIIAKSIREDLYRYIGGIVRAKGGPPSKLAESMTTSISWCNFPPQSHCPTWFAP